jgi:hypothetical protein
MQYVVDSLRTCLRRQVWWVEFREACQEGLRAAWRRRRLQRAILHTPPVRTAAAGPVEVRVLTWRRDWLNLLWALKSFYYLAGVDYPLVIHDGGLVGDQARQLLRHFPDARFVGRDEADEAVSRALGKRGLERCLAYRRRNPSTWKLFDFFCLSRAEYVISIDSDIVFFRRPDQLLPAGGTTCPNRYNEDCGYWYSMTLDEMEANFGLRPVPRLNSGLSLVRPATIAFEAMEGWLAHPKLFGDPWVTEQTLHALNAALCGAELLPATYCVSAAPGFPEGVVCKHYPGYYRPLLYEEGMARLRAGGFLKALTGEPGGRRWA